MLIKNVKLYKYCHCFLEYTNFKDDLIEYKCLRYCKNCQTKFNKKLKERFFNTYKCSKHDDNKFFLSLQKGVYPCEIYGRLGKIQ